MPSRLNSFLVTFEKNMDVFQAGQVVRGQVELDVNKDYEMKGLYITLKGYAKVRWVVHNGKHTIVYTGRDLYFEDKMPLWGQNEPKTGDHPVLPAGKHTFPFQYQLPSAGLPTSFEGCHGHVRYYAKASIDRPWNFDKTAKKYFTVLDMLDLNQDPEATTTSSAEESKTLGVWPFASDPIEVHVQTDRGAYCPGETIRLAGTLKNGSDTDIKETTLQIRQKTTFIATSPHKSKRNDRTTLSEIKALGCKGKDQADLGGVSIQVPSIPPSSQRYCSVIDVVYKLKFTVNIPGPHTNLEVDLPITIGSIPLKSYYPQAPSFPLHPVEQSPPSHEPLYPDLAGFAQWTYPTATDPSAPPPPYYAVSSTGPVKMEDDEEKGDKYDMGSKEFAPKYTFYDWSKHT